MSEGLDTVIGGGAIDEARADAVFKPVSYTHLTLPTIYSV